MTEETTLPAPLSYQFGDAKITVIIDDYSAGAIIDHTLSGARKAAQAETGMGPFTNPDGSLKARVQGFLIEIGDKKILIDTCIGDNKTRTDFKAWHQRKDNHFIDNLARAGVKPDEVTHVFCTHFHQDHVGWNTRFEQAEGQPHGRWVPTFENARYLFSKKENKFWGRPNKKMRKRLRKYPDVRRTYFDSIKPVIDAGLADLIDIKDGAPLIPEMPNLTLISTPGHTPDHASLLLEIAGLKIIFTGDAFHHPVQFPRTDLTANGDTDPVRGIQSRDDLIGQKADIYFGPHFDAGAAVTLSADPERPGRVRAQAFSPLRFDQLK